MAFPVWFTRSPMRKCSALIRHLRYPNVTLLTNALVKRLETDPSGREVQRVVVERNGELETYSADIVVVSCGAINSAALLLRSANDKHPNGLAKQFRRGWPPLYGTHELCFDGDFQVPQSNDLSKDALGQ